MRIVSIGRDIHVMVDRASEGLYSKIIGVMPKRPDFLYERFKVFAAI